MLGHIDVSAPQKDYEPDAALLKYIQKKVGKLDRHIHKDDRSETRADVKLKETNAKGPKKCTVEVILHIPGNRLTASASTVNMHAAVDIVEDKLQRQIKRSKEKNSLSSDKRKNSGARRAFGKFLRRR